MEIRIINKTKVFPFSDFEMIESYLFKMSADIRDRQPMVRASVTECWAQVKSGYMILSTHDLYANIIFLRNAKSD